MSDIPSKLAFIDIETTGNSPLYDRIVEIGILRVEDGKLTKTYSTLLNPETYLSPFIENLTGIDKNELENAPTFQEVKHDIYDMLADCVFVAHNVRFDYGFVKSEFKKHEMSFSAKQFCTVKLSRHLFPEYTRHNLDALIERFNLSCESRHRAFDDAKVLWDFYQILEKTLPTETFVNGIQHILKKPSIPPHLTQEHLNELPEAPGVYLFYSDDVTPLYIGKSTNIKERVQSHFTSDYESKKELEIAQQVKRIETIQTSGDLSAQLLESHFIKEMQPLYNRKLRYRRKLTILRKVTNEAGYDCAELQEIDQIEINDIDTILGVFRSKKQAKELLNALVKSHSLCQKLLGLTITDGACFAHQLEWCKGACLEKEKPIIYNMRFLQAFSQYKIKSWPFATPIMIEESFDKNKEFFLVDKWCVLKHMKEKEQDIDTDQPPNLFFDYDAYKILVSYIFNHTNKIKIKPLSIAYSSFS